MNRFVIVDGLPYLYADGKTYAVRWDENGFTVGAEVHIFVPSPIFTLSELSVKAKCAGRLDSIAAVRDEQQDEQQTRETEADERQDEQQARETELEALTVAELREFAVQRGIALGEAKKKAEILEAIKGVME